MHVHVQERVCSNGNTSEHAQQLQAGVRMSLEVTAVSTHHDGTAMSPRDVP